MPWILEANRPAANAIMSYAILLVAGLTAIRQSKTAVPAATRNNLSFKTSQLLFRPANARWRRDDLLTWPGTAGPNQRMRSRRS